MKKTIPAQTILSCDRCGAEDIDSNTHAEVRACVSQLTRDGFFGGPDEPRHLCFACVKDYEAFWEEKGRKHYAR